MLFHTWTFAVFALVVWVGYLICRKTRWCDAWLLAASYFFYGCWSPLYLLLVLYSTVVDYAAVALMARTRLRKTWLVVSLVNNLGLLGFFKYASFLTDNLNALLQSAQIPWELDAPNVLLPMGISFYTFQSMSYTIDYYRGRIPEEPNFFRFAAYVALFPQLVAGPIERAESLLPQLREHPAPRWLDVAQGLSLFEVGLFKKVALANYLALYVEPIYADPGRYDGLSLWLATIAFSWQIYFDFSGYSDMARGVARCFGWNLMVNFRHPYLATDLSDFWSRWHISLSQWFRDYVYIPLGGNRVGVTRLVMNLMITFLLSGIWHGASWNFVIWGAWHGLGVVASRWLTQAKELSWLGRFTRVLWVYLFVLIGWVFFRAETLGDAWLVLSGMVAWAGQSRWAPVLLLGLIALVWSYQAVMESSLRSWLEKPVVAMALAMLMMLYLVLIPGGEAQPFIYFQF